MSGFAVSATRIGQPDTGLISYGEMLDQGRNITASVSIPVIGDGDTGYGNALNVQRTVRGYAQAGFACVMLEDQVWPKRCGHTQGKQVVERDEAVQRIKAAVECRNDGADILIMARTDARATHGFTEALSRAQAFAEAGADIIFLEAPQSEKEMRIFCDEIEGYTMANMLEHGQTPQFTPAELAQMGFKIAAYPLTLLNVALSAMQQALTDLKQGKPPQVPLSFAEIQKIVGFAEYYELEKRYSSE